MKNKFLAIASLSVLALASCGGPAEITPDEALSRATEISAKVNEEDFAYPEDYKMVVESTSSLEGSVKLINEVYLSKKFLHTSIATTSADGEATVMETYIFLKDGSYYTVVTMDGKTTSVSFPESVWESSFEEQAATYDPKEFIGTYSEKAVSMVQELNELTVSSEYTVSVKYSSSGAGSLILDAAIVHASESGDETASVKFEYANYLLVSASSVASTAEESVTEKVSITYNASGLAYPELA